MSGQGNTNKEVSEVSRTRRPPLERNLEDQCFLVATQDENAIIPSPEDIMEDLREVTVQYTSCVDPVERTARRMRVIQGEERGLMAETAARILASATEAVSLNFQQTQKENVVEHNELESQPEENPVVQRTDLGKRRRGRPPINKQNGKSPLKLTGARSQKRNLCLSKGSPIRSTSHRVHIPLNEENRLGNTEIASASRQFIPLNEENTGKGKKSAPKVKIIPAIKKGGVDFQNPPAPLP